MKVIAITAFLLAALLLGGWVLFQVLQPHQSALDMHPAMFEKPEIEMAETHEMEPQDSPEMMAYLDPNRTNKGEDT